MWWHTVTHGWGSEGETGEWSGSQYSHTTSEGGVSSITTADAHTSAASSRLNSLPRRFKWTLPFKRKTKCGFCACAIRFRTSYNNVRGCFCRCCALLCVMLETLIRSNFNAQAETALESNGATVSTFILVSTSMWPRRLPSRPLPYHQSPTRLQRSLATSRTAWSL